MKIFNFIGNILWFIFGGLILGLFWSILGVILCITIIGIPFGVQCFKTAKLSFFPYGKKVKIHFFKHPIVNTIWAILFGWELTLLYLILGIVYCITVIGISRGIQIFKFAKLALLPFGAEVN